MEFPQESTSRYRFHEADDDHDHEGFAELPDEEHPMWRSERVALNSVGIDIGSSTSHLIFSRLVLRRLGVALSSRFVVVQRDIVYESPILLTPYLDRTTIDTEALGAFIEEAYRQANLTPQAVDTGAVIVTGEAAKKKNAEAIAALFSAQAGKFVCATAGHNLEAILAAHGSGAVRLTLEAPGELTVMNVDIGGGTSKIAIVRGGAVVDTAALEVGARLVALNGDGRVDRLEEAGLKVAAAAGVELKLGGLLREREKQAIATRLSDCLFEVLDRGPLSPLTRSLMLTPALSFAEPIDLVQFSGGVSEYIYGFESRDLGDLGIELGRTVAERARLWRGARELNRPPVRIRATVIGASQYTVQVSGNTIYLSRPELLPLRNLQVVRPQIPMAETLAPEEVRVAIEQALRRYDLVNGERGVALAIRWELGPSYPLIRSLAEGVVEAMREHLGQGQPLVLVFDADIARLVGNIVEREILPGSGIVSIDGIELKDFDFVDIGEELPDAKAVPVVIKSLIFRHAEWGRGLVHRRR